MPTSLHHGQRRSTSTPRALSRIKIRMLPSQCAHTTSFSPPHDGHDPSLAAAVLTSPFSRSAFPNKPNRHISSSSTPIATLASSTNSAGTIASPPPVSDRTSPASLRSSSSA